MFYILLITYILGGLTLVPLLVLSLLAFLFYTSLPVDAPKPRSKFQDAPSSNANVQKPSLKSWLTIRRTFESSPSSYISIVRTLLDARSTRPRRAEDTYFAALKGKILYLYEDELMSECAAAIDVGQCEVRVWPDEGLLEGELFAKRNAVLVREKGLAGEGKSSDDKEKDLQTQEMPAPWYIFFRAVNEMEDWYLALLAASTSITPEAFAPFPYTSQKLLIDSLDALPDLIPTRWLNALLGRLFLGVKGTKALEEWVVGRLMKKLSKVKTPSWLSAVVVRSFDAGDVAPVLSKPMLKELTPEGEASVGVDVSYIAPPDGGIRITLSATATISLPATPSLSMLGFKKDSGKDRDPQKDKPYEVSLVLAVIVRRVEGNMLVKIKRPPSDRLWYAFTTTPRMDIEVTPVVSDRQIRWGMVLSGIEGKLREIIQDSIVLPNMDDVPFFDSSPYPLRGGIFADAFAAPSFEHPSEPHTAATTTASEPKEDVMVDQEGEKRVHRSRSAEVLVEGGWDEPAVLGPPEPDTDIQRAETIGLGTRVESGNGSVRKRRTWFGGRRSEDSEDGASEGSGEHRRGRSEEGPGVRVMVTEDENREYGQMRERPSVAQRRSSARSVSDSSPFPRSSSPIDDSYTPTAGLSTSAPSASSPTTASSTSTSSPASPSASSFLSTLKSRGAGMAEKQPALKEAMRKWGVGVNWAAGLRKNDKDSNSNTPSLSSLFRDRERERGRERDALDAPDHGDVWSGEDGRGNASPRGSYADLRRKVEQRERERSRDASGSSGSEESGTQPIDIPGAKEHMDVPLQRHGSSTSWSDVSATPSTRRIDSSAGSGVKLSPPGGGPASFLSPSAPKTTTELHLRTPSPTPIRSKSSTPPPQARDRSPASTRSTDNAASFSHTTDIPTTPPRPAAPIRAQPKAATMTIPGIHARHKGEVMGFGSSQPSSSSSPVTPVTGVASSSAASTPTVQASQPASTGKAIQSVYKLFRSGTSGGPGESMGEPPEGEQRIRTTSTPLPAQTSGPPPLPPRAQPIPVLETEPSPPSPVSSTPHPEAIAPTPPTLFSAASQALKSLAEQDAAARQPPPLPARRTSSSSAHSRQSSSYAERVIAPPSDSEQNYAPIEKEDGSSTSRTPSSNEDPNWRPPLPPRANGTRERTTSSVQ